MVEAVQEFAAVLPVEAGGQLATIAAVAGSC